MALKRFEGAGGKRGAVGLSGKLQMHAEQKPAPPGKRAGQRRLKTRGG